MSETVIKIENLYKEYRLGVVGHGTLYRDLQSWWARVQGKEDPNSLIGHEDRELKNENVLALNNLNLEIKKGEILGIIGANGAGKSTLLKILSRVTTPTSGLIKIKGRIASLLEVGTGFHTELTGRENIYLNGSINGMGRNEVTKKLDEIVQFSGVEKFIDTPVKRYSSGMYVRLGFAVAAHLDPDILVVDEVLAVGDIAFQKKAIGKMQEISNTEGRTILFVSHNMSAIQNLCNRAILIEKGQIKSFGQTKDVIELYLGSDRTNLGEKVWDEPSKTNKPKDLIPGQKTIQLKSVHLLNNQGKICTKFTVRENIIFKLRYIIPQNNMKVIITLFLHNERGELVFAPFNNKMYKMEIFKNEYVSKCEIPKDFLNEGEYCISLVIRETDKIHIRETNLITFVVSEDLDSKGSRGEWLPNEKWPPAVVRPKFKWKNTQS